MYQFEREQLASILTSQYALFASHANAAFWRASIKSNAGQMMTPGMLTDDLVSGAKTFLSVAVSYMNMQALNVSAGDPEVAAALQAHTDEAAKHFTGVVNSIIKSVVTDWRRQMVGNQIRTPGFESMNFRHADAVGRSIHAEHAVNVAARAFSVNIYLTSQAIMLKRAGVKEVRLVYPEMHRNQNAVLKLDEIEAWRREHFHPNSKAMVVAND